MAKKRIGFKTLLQFADSTGGTFTTLANVKSISHSGGGASDVDTTTLDSTSNFRTFARGPVDPGSLSVDVAFNSTDASHKKIGTLYRSGDEKVFKINFSSTTETDRLFLGYINDMGEEIPLDDLIMQSVSIKLSGDPNFASTAGAVALSS